MLFFFLNQQKILKTEFGFKNKRNENIRIVNSLNFTVFYVIFFVSVQMANIGALSLKVFKGINTER